MARMRIALTRTAAGCFSPSASDLTRSICSADRSRRLDDRCRATGSAAAGSLAAALAIDLRQPRQVDLVLLQVDDQAAQRPPASRRPGRPAAPGAPSACLPTRRSCSTGPWCRGGCPTRSRPSRPRGSAAGTGPRGSGRGRPGPGSWPACRSARRPPAPRGSAGARAAPPSTSLGVDGSIAFRHTSVACSVTRLLVGDVGDEEVGVGQRAAAGRRPRRPCRAGPGPTPPPGGRAGRGRPGPGRTAGRARRRRSSGRPAPAGRTRAARRSWSGPPGRRRPCRRAAASA